MLDGELAAFFTETVGQGKAYHKDLQHWLIAGSRLSLENETCVPATWAQPYPLFCLNRLQSYCSCNRPISFSSVALLSLNKNLRKLVRGIWFSESKDCE